MSITIRDVAVAAGVSPMAVSRVLHGKGSNVRVSMEKAELIKRVATELNYTPNNLARSLRGGKTKTLGLVFDQFGPIAQGSRYFAHLLDGITATAFEQGYAVTLCPELAANSLYNIGDGRFDGVLWGKSLVQPEAVQAAKRADVKIVHLHVPPGPSGPGENTHVCCDNHQGIRLAMDHLTQLGHSNIGFAQERASASNTEAQVREGIFIAECERRDLPLGPSSVANWRFDPADCREWLLANPDVTAIILRTEGLAGVLYEAAKDLKISIPEQLSVVGFDSTDYCDLLKPSLTSISQPIEDMARQAVQLLVDLIEGRREGGEFITFPCGFDIRSSTASPVPQG